MSAPFRYQMTPYQEAQVLAKSEELGLHPAELIRRMFAHSDPDIVIVCGGVKAGPPDWDAEAANLIAAEKAKDRDDLENGCDR